MRREFSRSDGMLMRRGKNQKANEVMTRLVEICAQRLSDDLGFDAQQAGFVAREIAHTWCAEVGGGDFYLPRDMEFALSSRDLQIWESFNGRNTWELSQQFGLTERQIRYILGVMRKRSVEVNQMRLPGLDPPE